MSTNEIKVTSKITLKIHGQEHELTIDEAKQLSVALEQIIKPNQHTLPSIYDQPFRQYPQYMQPVWKTHTQLPNDTGITCFLS